MALIQNSSPSFMTAEQAVQRGGWAARSELMLRNALEEFCRNRWPRARVVHEMVMGERRVRADVVAIDPAHIAAFEVKGEYDNTTRLLHQVGMYQLCVPEVWMVVPVKHNEDAKLIRHLLPSVGLLVGDNLNSSHALRSDAQSVTLTVEAEAVPRPVAVDMMLEMMWAAELAGMCDALRVSRGKKATRSAMIKSLRDLPVSELQAACCTELRAREALWRADAAIQQSAAGK